MLVGLTGGIGSGKTSVSNAFAKLGAPVVDTDIIARDVLQIQPKLLEELSHSFGNSIINAHNSLNRENLRKIAFSNKENKAKMDSIMHPAIRKQTLIEIEKCNQSSYCLVVVPLLIETNFKTLVDRVLVVTASTQRKLAWLKKRSNLSTKEAQAIINAQTSDNERLSHANDHIINDKGLAELNQQVQKLHETYLAIANS